MEQYNAVDILQSKEVATSTLGKTYLYLFTGFLTMAIGGFAGLIGATQLLANVGSLGFFLIAIIAQIAFIFLTLKNTYNFMGVVFYYLFTISVGFFDGPIFALILSSPFMLKIFGQALVLTTFVTFGLSLYVLITKKDFSYLSGTIFTLLLVIIGLSVIGIFVHNNTFHLLLSGASAFIFGLFILYDTSKLVREKTHPLAAAIGLFLDIINLFWSIFRILLILSGGRDE